MLNTVMLDNKKPQKGHLMLNLLSLSKGTKVLEKSMPEMDIQGKPRAVFDSEGKLLVRTDRKVVRLEDRK